ncbi:MAG: HPr kinase/phosphatase C-terminal domain-containing protein [Proteobacteria bacterium]|nr:HPr kinase/phosphatase C-terminal domain-containing protein [Pseudomonadota bacterium]
MTANIHASCVSLNNKGILIIGASGLGKSDLCLRLIMERGARLVADDRVDLRNVEGQIVASAPEVLRGLLEVRGLGIIKQPFVPETPVHLIVKLVNSYNEVERLPDPFFYELEGARISQISLWAFEPSAVLKVVAAMTLL